jgi:excisionase family DNA binding protein
VREARNEVRAPKAPAGVVLSAPAVVSPYWTVPEAATYMRCSKKTVYDYAKGAPGNGFPVKRPGKKGMLIHAERLKLWIEEQE